MKKITAVLLIAVLLLSSLSFSGCGKKELVVTENTGKLIVIEAKRASEGPLSETSGTASSTRRCGTVTTRFVKSAKSAKPAPICRSARRSPNVRTCRRTAKRFPCTRSIWGLSASSRKTNRRRNRNRTFADRTVKKRSGAYIRA